jgi:hypothetical protein
MTYDQVCKRAGGRRRYNRQRRDRAIFRRLAVWAYVLRCGYTYPDTLHSLAATWQCSERTIYRDLSAMLPRRRARTQ